MSRMSLTHRSSTPAGLLLVAIGTTAGCSGTEAPANRSDPPPPPPGVPVVDNPAEGVWAPGEEWTVEEVFAVGSADGDDAYRFGEITGMDVDDDGNVYVADSQARAIQVFDPTGGFVRTLGRPGEGPGEFGVNLAGVFVVDDQVFAPDPSQARISRFSLDGAFVSSVRLDMAQGIPIRWDTSRDRLVAQRRLPVAPGSTPSSGDPIVTFSQPADTIVRLASGQSVQITGGIPLIRQFEPEPFWDAGPDGRLVTGMSDAWRFSIHNAEGDLVRIVTRPVSAESVSGSDERAVKEALREMYRRQGVPPEAVAEVIASMEFADHLPTFASLAFGPNDSLWVQHFRSPRERAAQGFEVFVADMGSLDWSVFDADGVYLGVVSFPEDFRPVRFVGDLLYGVVRDPLDVQSVRAYRVVTE